MANKKGYIKLSWSGVNDEYIIEYSTDGTNYQFLARVKDKEYIHANLDPNTRYYYRVWGVTNSQKSRKCATISAYPKDTTPPSPPVILNISGITEGFQITLQQPSEFDWAGFRIYASKTPNFQISSSNLVADLKGTKIQVTGLEGGTVYYVKAVAYDTAGNVSNPSSEISVTTVRKDDITPPATPQGLTLSTYLEDITGNRVGQYTACIKATWQANSEPDLEGYQLRLRKVGESDYTVVATRETSYIFRGLKGGINYGVQIRAYDKSGNYSNWSNEATITAAGDSTPPPTPTNFTAQGYFKTITLRWAHSSAPDLAGYELYASQDPNFTPSPSNLVYIGLSNSYTFTADVNQTWYFKLRAFDTSGNTSGYVSCSGQTAQITGADIATNTIAANHIMAEAITTDKIAANAITGEKIAANSIEARHIKAYSLTLTALSSDYSTVFFATSFEDDTNNDGIPDGFVALTSNSSIYLTTEDSFRGNKSLCLECGPYIGNYAEIITENFFPCSREDLPYFVYTIFKAPIYTAEVVGIFKVYEFDSQKILVNTKTTMFPLSFYNWLDGLFIIGIGPTRLEPETKYVKIGFTVYRVNAYSAPTPYKFYIDLIKIYPMEITTANMATIEQGNIFKIYPVERLIWEAYGVFSANGAGSYNYVQIKNYQYEDCEFKQYSRITYQIRQMSGSGTYQTRLRIREYYWSGRVYTYKDYLTQPQTYLAGTSTYTTITYQFSPSDWPRSLGKQEIIVEATGVNGLPIDVTNFQAYGGSWAYVI